ncbi:MAG: site-specific integrase [Pseudomonadota bacterium]
MFFYIKQVPDNLSFFNPRLSHRIRYNEKQINRAKLTKRTVESSVPGATKRTLIWDTEITGFCVRIYPTGRKTYFFQYRNPQRQTKFLKLGVHGNVTTEQARETAKQLALKVSAGEDPSVKKVPVAGNHNMEELAQKYLKLHAEKDKSPKSIKEDKAMLKNYVLKEFGTQQVAEVTFESIQDFHVRLKKKSVYANRILSLLHKMFNLAIQWRWRKDNPASNVKKYKENKRTRWLQEEELKRLIKVLDAYHNQTVSNIVHFLLLTGARKHEVLEATWDQFDLKKGIWTKLAHKTKQREMAHTPLSPAALEILRAMHQTRTDSAYLFPGRVPGQPVKDFKKAWATIRKQADLKDFTVHDMRHTYASHLVSSGLSLTIVGKLLGHTQAATTQRYAHLADEPLREATNLFAEKFQKLTEGEEI